MSVMGVVHVIQGEEKEAEFTELGEWIRWAQWLTLAAVLVASETVIIGWQYPQIRLQGTRAGWTCMLS